MGQTGSSVSDAEAAGSPARRSGEIPRQTDGSSSRFGTSMPGLVRVVDEAMYGPRTQELHQERGAVIDDVEDGPPSSTRIRSSRTDQTVAERASDRHVREGRNNSDRSPNPSRNTKKYSYSDELQKDVYFDGKRSKFFASRTQYTNTRPGSQPHGQNRGRSALNRKGNESNNNNKPPDNSRHNPNTGDVGATIPGVTVKDSTVARRRIDDGPAQRGHGRRIEHLQDDNTSSLSGYDSTSTERHRKRPGRRQRRRLAKRRADSEQSEGRVNAAFEHDVTTGPQSGGGREGRRGEPQSGGGRGGGREGRRGEPQSGGGREGHRGEPQAMPAKRNSGILAEDEGRLLEPGSSREDDDSNQLGSADNAGQQASPNPDLSPNPDTAQDPSPSDTLSSEKLSGTSKTGTSGQRNSSRGKQRNRSPNLSGEGVVKGGSGRGRASPGQPLQKVVYYQNRFITIPIEPGAAGASSAGSGESAASRSREGQQQDELAGPRAGQAGEETRSTQHPVDMEPIALDEPGAKGNKSSSGFGKAASCLKAFHARLEDNRMQTGNQKTQDKIKDMNTNQSDSHRILKKILNIIFVFTGVSLFIAVIIVIIYTSIVDACSIIEFENATWNSSLSLPGDVVQITCLPDLGLTFPDNRTVHYVWCVREGEWEGSLQDCAQLPTDPDGPFSGHKDEKEDQEEQSTDIETEEFPNNLTGGGFPVTTGDYNAPDFVDVSLLGEGDIDYPPEAVSPDYAYGQVDEYRPIEESSPLDNHDVGEYETIDNEDDEDLFDNYDDNEMIPDTTTTAPDTRDESDNREGDRDADNIFDDLTGRIDKDENANEDTAIIPEGNVNQYGVPVEVDTSERHPVRHKESRHKTRRKSGGDGDNSERRSRRRKNRRKNATERPPSERPPLDEQLH